MQQSRIHQPRSSCGENSATLSNGVTALSSCGPRRRGLARARTAHQRRLIEATWRARRAHNIAAMRNGGVKRFRRLPKRARLGERARGGGSRRARPRELPRRRRIVLEEPDRCSTPRRGAHRGRARAPRDGSFAARWFQSSHGRAACCSPLALGAARAAPRVGSAPVAPRALRAPGPLRRRSRRRSADARSVIESARTPGLTSKRRLRR